ncbi:hypothetical protein LTR93_006855 [Exophiala xenobiotica]|nr:hypothetical protein LTR93_006855 [Exophiala xenobiotica]
MAAPGPFSFKTNVGRTITQKWRNANKINYDGDEWGDDDDDEYDEPATMSAGNARHPAWAQQPNMYSANRSVTNPSPSRGGGRLSFDRGDDRRTFSSSGGFDSAYPTTQRQPFPEPQHEYEDSPFPNFNGPGALRLDTQGQRSMSPGFRPGSRGRNVHPYDDAPFSAPGAYPPSRRSGSSNRPPPPVDPYQRHDSPMRPGSRGSTASPRQFPPRKQSLSQQPPPPMELARGPEAADPSSSTDAIEPSVNRPIPVFVRPSDIYKRMEEEKEKVRRSQESSRHPSIDSNTGRVRGDPVNAPPSLPEPKDFGNAVSQPQIDEPDHTRRLKPTTLDTVPERKSEYGFDNLIKQADSSQQPEDEAVTRETDTSHQPQEISPTVGVSRQSTDASSVSNYTDRPDPVSASTISRNVSMNEGALEHESPAPVRPSFNLPAIDRMSGFGMDLGSVGGESTRDARGLPVQLSNSSGDMSGDAQSYPQAQAQYLHHQPSLGYRSMVQQAFAESERDTPFSPTSISGTVDRSNSNSTSDISPIITQKGESAEAGALPIPGEPSRAESRPTSSATLRPHEPLSPGSDFSPAGPVRGGYRRDVTPPSRENSPAKRPVSIDHPTPIHSQKASVVDRKGEDGSVDNETRGRSPPAEETVPEPSSEETDSTESAVPQTERTTSEEYQEWQAQKQQINNQAGFSDTGRAAPFAPSPLQRSETPSKGSVRELAERIESQSGRSTPSGPGSPVSSPIVEHNRPAPQPRYESFRPAIPGGWQSYTSTANTGTPGDSTPGQRTGGSPSRNLPPFAPSRRLESTESIPTAKAPAKSPDTENGIKEKAFAAAATAGSALASALAGHRLSERVRDSQEYSDESSENEWDASSTDSEPGSENEPEREHGPGPQNRPDEEAIAPVSQLTGLTSAEQPVEHRGNIPTPDKEHAPGEAGTAEPEDEYVPAPLRTSRNLDTLNPRGRVPDVFVHQESPGEADNARLEEEIEKSLTPKSSTYYGEAAVEDKQARGSKALPSTSDSAGPSRRPKPDTSPTAVVPTPDAQTMDTAKPQSRPTPTVTAQLATAARSIPGRQSPSLSPPPTTGRSTSPGQPSPGPPFQQRPDPPAQQRSGPPAQQAMEVPPQQSRAQPSQPALGQTASAVPTGQLPSSRYATQSATNPQQGPATRPTGPTSTTLLSSATYLPPEAGAGAEPASQATAMAGPKPPVQTGPRVQPVSAPQSNPARNNLTENEVDSMTVPPQERALPGAKPDISSTTPSQPTSERGPSEPRPFLQQRFSWETGSEATPPASTLRQTPSTPSTGSPETIKTPFRTPSGPLAGPRHASNERDPTSPETIARQPSMPGNAPQASMPIMQQPVQAAMLAQTPAAEPVPFRAIMSLESPQARIKAFNEIRSAYATSDGQLENWLTSMRTSEHSDVFAMNGHVSQEAAEATSHRPSQRRILTDSAGARQMQEDGKRLISKAGKFGGKAGTAAKGLFAKGKERMRHGSSPSGRRKSTGRNPSLNEPSSEDSHAEAQAQRKPTFLEGPPQIPLTLTSPVSPSDWFTGPSLDNPLPGSGLSKETPAVLPTASIDQAGAEKEGSGSERKSSTIPAVVATTAGPRAVSPAISALDSDQHGNENESGPSRSVSQVTRPTAEHSPVEAPPRTIADQIADRGTASSQQTTSAATEPGPAVGALAPPHPVARDADGSTQPSDGSLRVPEGRPRSIISAVSSASPGSGSVVSEARSRPSVSPADEASDLEQKRQDQPHPLKAHPSSAPLQAHPLQEEQQPESRDGQDNPDFQADPETPRNETPPPGIDEPHVPLDGNVDADAIRRAQAGEEKSQVPRDVEQRVQEQEQDVSPLPRRPFSFATLEGAGEMHDPQRSPHPSQPMSPVSQTLSNTSLNKEMSQVSVDEVFDQSNAAAPVGKRQSRSYSRPFGVDPNIRNHPALKDPADAEQSQQPIDRTQMYSSESPLPSARRPQGGDDQIRQQQREQSQSRFQSTQPTQTSIQTDSTGEFRIAGPYIQEYRSPKSVTVPRIGRSPVQVEASGEQLPSARRSPYPGQDPYRGQQAQPQVGMSYASSGQQPYDEEEQEPGYRPAPGTEHLYDMKPEPQQQPQARPQPQSQPQPQQQQQQPSNEHYSQPQRYSMPPPPVPPPQEHRPTVAPGTPSKKSMFGGLFGNKPRSKLQKHEWSETPTKADESPTPKKEKRASLFRRNSRHDSLSSKRSSQYGDHDQLGHITNVPSHTNPGRRLSKDMLRGVMTTPEPKDRGAEGKKKRFSGFGGRLFKGSGGAGKEPSRANTAPAMASSQQVANQELEQQIRAQTFISPQAYSAQTPYTQTQSSDIPAAYGYQNPGTGAGQYQHPSSPASTSNRNSASRPYPPIPPERLPSHYPIHGPVAYQHQHQHQPANTMYERSVVSPPPPQGPSPPNYDPSPPSISQQAPYERPSPLRIDTSSGNSQNRSHSPYGMGMGVPATAPPQVYPPREGSFSAPPTLGEYNAGPTSAGGATRQAQAVVRSMTASPAERQNGPGTGQDPRAHVVDLHKRSRSPRLGRKPSSESLDARPRRSGQSQSQEPAGVGRGDSGLVTTLGMFNSKKISPVGGVPRDESEQERPFNIMVPGLDETGVEDGGGERRKGDLRERLHGAAGGVARSATPVSVASSTHTRSQTAGQEREGGHGQGQDQGQGLERGVSLMEGDRSAAAGKDGGREFSARDRSGGVIAELPGSKAEGYESDEEVLMSATAYPGQEWVPVMLGDGRWDD